MLPGDEILIDTDDGTAVYEVIVTERHEKTALADVENLWNAVPGRLVLITCFFEASGDTASDNMVIYAKLMN